jgi:hypothetical protein
MPFTVDPNLIENDEVRLTENNSGNLEIVHVPTSSSLEIDQSGAVSTLGNSDEEIQDIIGGIVTNGLVYNDGTNTISVSDDIGGGFSDVTEITSNHTAVAQEAVLADASSGPITVTLPTPVAGDQIGIKKIDSSTNAVTIATPNNETIDGQSSLSITNQFASREVLTAGTDYFII